MHSVPRMKENVAAADCVLVVTNHAAIDWKVIAEHARLCVDSRNALQKHLPIRGTYVQASAARGRCGPADAHHAAKRARSSSSIAATMPFASRDHRSPCAAPRGKAPPAPPRHRPPRLCHRARNRSRTACASCRPAHERRRPGPVPPLGFPACAPCSPSCSWDSQPRWPRKSPSPPASASPSVSAGGYFDYDTDGSNLDDDTDAGFFRLQFEGTSKRGFGGGLRLESYTSDDDLFAGTGFADSEASNGTCSRTSPTASRSTASRCRCASA